MSRLKEDEYSTIIRTFGQYLINYYYYLYQVGLPEYVTRTRDNLLLYSQHDTVP